MVPKCKSEQYTECRRHLTMSNMINFLASTTALSTFTTQLLPVTVVLQIKLFQKKYVQKKLTLKILDLSKMFQIGWPQNLAAVNEMI